MWGVLYAHYNTVRYTLNFTLFHATAETIFIIVHLCSNLENVSFSSLSLSSLAQPDTPLRLSLLAVRFSSIALDNCGEVSFFIGLYETTYQNVY